MQTQRIHKHGLVELIDCMPRLVPPDRTADYAVVQSARVSYGQGTKTLSADADLIRYLMRHQHTSPFEMVDFKFFIRMPIFVARQWMRHRTASINEYSARYSIHPEAFYCPDPSHLTAQSSSNRQGRDATAPMPAEAVDDFETVIEKACGLYADYQRLLSEHGLSREIARIVLPQNIYTTFYWKCNLRNVFHLLGLRMDPHAQEEIRDYALRNRFCAECVVC